MHLLKALGVSSANELDPDLPVSLGPFELSAEATVEAIRILEGGGIPSDPKLSSRDFQEPVYWSIDHATEGNAELFGFPKGLTHGLTTAMELALVRAIAAADPSQHDLILAGGVEIVLGTPSSYRGFQRLFAVVEPPKAGASLLVNQANQASVKEDMEERLTQVALNCLKSSFRTSPLKFRFIELYRVMEARFLADVRTKLFANFDRDPSTALTEASEALKSEMNQIVGLAETEQDAFEACWMTFDDLKNRNEFVTALFRRMKSKEAKSGGRAKVGAALIYQTRCAIVHAGAGNMIFENFPDGEDAIAAVLPDVERAVLSLIGLRVT